MTQCARASYLFRSGTDRENMLKLLKDSGYKDPAIGQLLAEFETPRRSDEETAPEEEDGEEGEEEAPEEDPEEEEEEAWVQKKQTRRIHVSGNRTDRGKLPRAVLRKTISKIKH